MTQAFTTIVAPNASLLTGQGTNTIVLGGGMEGATVIDPAEDNLAYLENIIRIGSELGDIRRILITHGHSDHMDGAAALRRRLGIYIYAFSRQGVPIADEEVPDGCTFPAGDDTLRAIYTPGHRFDHLCFYLEGQRTLFAGDLVAGTGTVVIIPPEGNMLDYLQSLKRLQKIQIAEIVPGHGPIITDPQAKLSEYITHRLQREQQIIATLLAAPEGLSIAEIVHHIYSDVDPQLHFAAARSVEAHLLKLKHEDHVQQLSSTIWSLKA